MFRLSEPSPVVSEVPPEPIKEELASEEEQLVPTDIPAEPTPATIPAPIAPPSSRASTSAPVGMPVLVIPAAEKSMMTMQPSPNVFGRMTASPPPSFGPMAPPPGFGQVGYNLSDKLMKLALEATSLQVEHKKQLDHVSSQLAELQHFNRIFTTCIECKKGVVS